MTNLVNKALDEINSLYAQVASLPDDFGSTHEDMVCHSTGEAVQQGLETTLRSIEALKQWETQNQKKAKLIRECYLVETKKNSMKTSLKFVRRAMQDEINLHSSRPIFRCIAKLSHLARNISVQAPPEELEMYIGDEEEDRISVMLYTNLFVVDLIFSETKLMKTDVSNLVQDQDASIILDEIKVQCESAKLEHCRGSDTVGNVTEVNDELRDATQQFIDNSDSIGDQVSENRLQSCLLSLTRSASASILLKGTGSSSSSILADDNSVPNSGEVGESKWMGPSSDIRVLLKHSFQNLPPSVMAPRTTIEGVELRIWPSSSLSAQTQFLRLSPATWRRRPVIACSLSCPLVMHLDAARQLFSVSLGYSLEMLEPRKRLAGMGSQWDELKACHCFRELDSIGGARVEEGWCSGGIFCSISTVAAPVTDRASNVEYSQTDDVYGHDYVAIHWLPLSIKIPLKSSPQGAEVTDFCLLFHLLRSYVATSSLASRALCSFSTLRLEHTTRAASETPSGQTLKLISLLPVSSPLATSIVQQSLLFTLNVQSGQRETVITQSLNRTLKCLVYFDAPSGVSARFLPTDSHPGHHDPDTGLHIVILGYDDKFTQNPILQSPASILKWILTQQLPSLIDSFTAQAEKRSRNDESQPHDDTSNLKRRK